MMAAPEFQIRLHRDGLNTPWGFRLQGGAEFKTPLTIQRVFVGSPADSELHRGDIIVAIENNSTAGLSHQVAQDIIKSAGGSLSLVVQRGCRPTPFTRTALPAPQHMFLKVQHSLGQAAYRGPGMMEMDPEPYEQRSVGDLKKKFGTSGQDRHPGIHRTGRRWQKSSGDDIGGGMMSFGWKPSNKPTPQPASRSYVPLRAPGQGPIPTPVNQAPTEQTYSTPSPQPAYQPDNAYQPDSAPYEPSRPAWLGSLKSEARGPVNKPWENDPVVAEQEANAPPNVVHTPRVQTVHYAPGQSPQYVPDAPQDHTPTARVVHLQYNSPLGLYSTGNVQESLEGQVSGRPGEGTMAVTGPAKEFDPNKSAVLKMLNQQNKPNPRRRIYQEEPTPALDLHGPGQQQQSYGTSDF